MISCQNCKILPQAVAVAILGLGSTQGAIAQESALEEVIVTAQKREQSLLEVPVSMQALSGDFLANNAVRDLSEVMTMVPSASEELSGTPTQRRYQIRGVGSGFLTADGTVGYYLNDSAFFLFGENFAPIARTFDMERVEVLRGPQSTLYGNGSMGGTVRFVTKKPNLESVEAHVRTGFSDTEGGESGNYIDAAVSLPIVKDTLGLRLVGSYEDIGGYQLNVFGDEDTNTAEIRSLRGELLWQASENLSLDLLYVSNEGDSDGGNLLLSLDPAVGLALPGDFNNDEQELAALTVDWDLGFATLVSNWTTIDTARDSLINLPFPGVGLPNDTLQSSIIYDGEAFNTETRLVSQGDGPLQWMAGVFYSDSEYEQAQVFNGLIPNSTQTFDSESISVFGEVSYSLLDGKLIPLFGVRYFEDDRESNITTATTQPGSETFDSVNPRFNLQWLPRDTSNYYLNIAKGFRSGNFNNPDVCGLHSLPPEFGGPGLPCEVSLDSDELWSYEAGAKWILAGGQLQLDVAAYYIDWQDIRQGVPAFGLFQEYQVGDAEITGLDLQVLYSPEGLKGLTLSATANFNESEFTDLDPAIAAATGAAEGGELPFAPDQTLSLAADYGWVMGDNWAGQASFAYRHIAGQLGQFGSSTVGDDRDLLSARLGVSFKDFGVAVFGRNLLGEDGAIYSQSPAGGLTAFTQDYPRQVGVELTYSFK